MAGKVMYLDREVLRINEVYVFGYGWITADQYQDLMYNPDESKRDSSPARLSSRIHMYNVQYKKPNGAEGQMDIGYESFWRNRTFVSDMQ